MKTLYLAAAAAFAVGAALPAQAAYITINDNHSTVSLFDGQFEHGFNANGNQLSTGYNSGSLTVASGTDITFDGTWVTYGQAIGSFDIYVVAQVGDPNAIAHLFGTVTASGSYSTISGTYRNGGSYAITGGTTVVAGNPADFSFAYDGNTLNVDAIPEPAMLGLFGLGAIGLGLSRRRKA